MWHTSCGDRTLDGAEAELVRASVGNMVDEIQIEAEGLDGHWTYGVQVFDRLSWQQQLAVLADVGEALLRADVAIMPLHAWNEAAVAAIFANMRVCVGCEVTAPPCDDPDLAREFSWLRLLHEAGSENCSPPQQGTEQSLPSELEEESTWEDIVDDIEGGILWDADYDDADLYLDASPETRERLEEQMAVGADYFTAVPPDPTEAELPAIWRRLEILTAGT